MTPIDPAEGFVETFYLLHSEGTVLQFQKILDLKVKIRWSVVMAGN